MEFSYAYASDSLVESDANGTRMALAPDTLREPTFFSGQLRQGLPFREAYRQPLKAEDLTDRTAESSLHDRISPGACGDLRLEELRERLDDGGPE